MMKWFLHTEHSVTARMFLVAAVALMVSGSTLTAQENNANKEAAPDDASPSLEKQFGNYLHFALMGRFDVADKLYAEPMLKRPDLNPLNDEAAEELIRITEEREDSMDTLLLLINNSSIADNAKKILGLIREAHKRKRMDPVRIKANIGLLTGDPMQRAVAMERLIDSGEYAVPWMVGVLADPRQKDTHPFVARALPALGKSAVNPLLASLEMDNEVALHHVIEALGKIGYPQALPYLQRLVEQEDLSEQTRQSAARAIAQIVVEDPAEKSRPASQAFATLAEQYYRALESLRPDPREDKANVWYPREKILPGEDVVEPVEVPPDIYPLVKCMQCCEASLALETDQPEVVSLWLAANFRRESQLGMDVQSEETVDARLLDKTRPEGFPRSIYFARIAGPTCSQIVLSRALRDRDRDVVLGAIASLQSTAGAQALVMPKNPNGTSLGEALYFPDLLVRVEAALALAWAMPTTPFKGSSEVVPVLASVLSPTDKSNYMVIDPTEASRSVIEAGLRNAGADVVASARLETGLNQAKQQMTHLDAIFLATDVRQPILLEAIRQLHLHDRFGLAPVILLVKESDAMILQKVHDFDARIGSVFVINRDDGSIDPKLIDQMLDTKEQIAHRFGHRELSPELRLNLAMYATGALKEIIDGRSSLFDGSQAQDALIATLASHPAEKLRVGTATILSQINSAEAQQAIATVALRPAETEALRMAAFGLLSDSARRFGPLLNDQLTEQLVEQATGEPNLALRTAASQALGALNLPVSKAASIIIESASPR